MIAGWWLAALCVALGIAPGYAMRLLDADGGRSTAPGRRRGDGPGRWFVDGADDVRGTPRPFVTMVAAPSSRSWRWRGSCAAVAACPQRARRRGRAG